MRDAATREFLGREKVLFSAISERQTLIKDVALLGGTFLFNIYATEKLTGEG